MAALWSVTEVMMVTVIIMANGTPPGVVDGTYNIYAVVSGCDDQKFQTDPITVIVDNNPPSVTLGNSHRFHNRCDYFDKELLNNPSTHQPTPEDFIIYHSGDSSSIDISSTTYADKVVTLTLAEPLVAGDNPTYVVLLRAKILARKVLLIWMVLKITKI